MIVLTGGEPLLRLSVDEFVEMMHFIAETRKEGSTIYRQLFQLREFLK